jgi:hypothetical protein
VPAPKLLTTGDFDEDGVIDALTLTDSGEMLVVTPGQANGS